MRVMKAIQEINPTKAHGPTKIHPKIIYECKNNLINYLEFLKKSSENLYMKENYLKTGKMLKMSQ